MAKPKIYRSRTSPIKDRLLRWGITIAAVAKNARRGHSTARDAILTGADSPRVIAAMVRLLNKAGDPITRSELDGIMGEMRANISGQTADI